MNKKSILIVILLLFTSVSALALESDLNEDMIDFENQSNNQLTMPFQPSFHSFRQRIQQLFSFIEEMIHNDFVDSLYEKIMNYFSLNDSLTVVTPTEASLCLEISKTDHLDEDQIIPKGELINYTITITNPDTNKDQSQVHVIDELPEEVTFISSDTNELYYDSDEHCTYIVYETLDSGVSRSFNITVEVKDNIETPKMINNTAKVNSSDLAFNSTYEKTAIGEFTPLVITNISLGTPKTPCFIEIDDTCYDAISSETPITIETSCTHSCDPYFDLEHLFVEVYQGESYGEWELLQTMSIDDNDEWDEDPSNDSIKINLYVEDDCWHQIHVWAEDKLGNRYPEQGHVLTKDFFVDATSPQSENWYTGSEYNTAYRWITNETIIHVESVDLGCNNQASGVNYTEWWLLKNEGETWVETHRERVYDNQDNDLDDSIGRILLDLQIEENGEYYFYYQSNDSLGNVESAHKHLVRVDSAPPISTVTVEEPNCLYYDGEEPIYCVTPDTMVHINSTDEEQHFAVGTKYIDYEIYRCEQLITSERVYDVNHVMFHFGEECTHLLRYRAVDLLDNKEQWNTQVFKVDDQKPSIYLTVNGEKVETDHDHPHYWIRSDTEIIIDGVNHGSCPEWNISYRINDGQWIDITDSEDRPCTFTLPDECKYTLEIMAQDCIGNSNYLVKRFYVDDTSPVFHIIKPHNGVYANGESIHATFYAEDPQVQSPPCYENHAIGIPSQSNGEAWIIDVYPEFQICPLDTTDFHYDEASFEYDGEVVIPSDCSIPDGSAYFVSGSFDRLNNGKGMIKNQIQHYYEKYGPSSNQFTQLIDQLLDENKILEIVIDNTPPEDDEPPIVSIVQPASDAIIDSDVLQVQISASDDETDSEELFVQVELTIPGYHQFLETATFDEATGFFELDFDVHCLKNNTQIKLRAFAMDLENNQGISQLVNCTIESDVYFAKWLDDGWNQLEFDIIEGEKDIASVFESIEEEYKLIFELDSESYFIADQNFNTLGEITTSRTYWVKMNEAKGFYLD